MAGFLAESIVRRTVRPAHRRSCVADLPAAAVFRRILQPAHCRGFMAVIPAAAIVRQVLQPPHRRGRVAGILAAAVIRGKFQPDHSRCCAYSSNRIRVVPLLGLAPFLVCDIPVIFLNGLRVRFPFRGMCSKLYHALDFNPRCPPPCADHIACLHCAGVDE